MAETTTAQQMAVLLLLLQDNSRWQRRDFNLNVTDGRSQFFFANLVTFREYNISYRGVSW